MEFATLQSRLASFEPPSKRSKLGWPHKTPTAAELANAGFYYKPSSTSNDNTICYLCERALDGWESDDDAVAEHLKHSSECGWAILMSTIQDGSYDRDTMEDPTAQHFADARRGTFAIGWPHESKRAWKCKTEKMVEAGWHFAPIPESEDYVSCLYCKLSLDGWEPKDDPFEEHYKRSPECPFFHFAGTTAPSKRPKAKKGRASKASRTSKASTRLSTQSQMNTTILSEAPSMTDIPDLDDSIDTSTTSVMSTMSTASTATTKGKRKGAGGRAKTTKAKRAKTTRSTRAKKEEAAPPVDEVEAGTEAVPEQSMATPQFTAQRTPPPAALPSPAASPPAAVAYPSIQNSPGVADGPSRELTPLAAPPHPSPTPVRTRAHPTASATRSTAASTPKPSEKRTRQTPNVGKDADATASPSTSDIENAPPSTRPEAVRPPPPSSQKPEASPLGQIVPQWTPADIELVFQPTSPQPTDVLALTGSTLTAEEQQMTVQEWIEHTAGQAEADLRAEAERVVSIFEREGARAMGVLEAIQCV